MTLSLYRGGASCHITCGMSALPILLPSKTVAILRVATAAFFREAAGIELEPTVTLYNVPAELTNTELSRQYLHAWRQLLDILESVYCRCFFTCVFMHIIK